MNLKEVFQEVKGYPNYWASNLGRIKRIKDGKDKILKQTLGKKNGYLYVSVKPLGKDTTPRLVHQLVAIAFLDHVPNKHTIVCDHINNIRTDNRAENIQLITPRENSSKDSKGTSAFTGVYWHKGAKKWLAQINIDGKQKSLGYHINEMDAGLAYQAALYRYYCPEGDQNK